jgi:nicotinate-nucleotide adenylyltransferase
MPYAIAVASYKPSYRNKYKLTATDCGGNLKRIGLFGGTFNPIHLGHLRAALEVKQGFNLDQIFLIPAAIPPHKVSGEIVNARDRMEMINLAVSADVDLAVSDVELKRSGPSYTIDTVNHFKQSLPQNTCIYLILGLDAFLEIDTWKSYEQLFEQIALIVITRPNSISECQDADRQALENELKSRISKNYSFSESKSCFEQNGKQPIHFFEVTALDISSTKIREMIKRGGSINYLVPPEVIEFIEKKGLYV